MEIAAAAIPPHPNYNSVHSLLDAATAKLESVLETSSLAPREKFKVLAIDNIQKKFDSKMQKMSYLENNREIEKSNVSKVATHVTCAASNAQHLSTLQQNPDLAPGKLMGQEKMKQLVGKDGWSSIMSSLSQG
jgi:hypothetical protein